MKRRDVISIAGTVGVLGLPLVSGCLNASDPETDGSVRTDDDEKPEGDDGPTNGPTDSGPSDADFDGSEWYHNVGGSVDAVAHGYVFGREDVADDDGDGGVFALDLETGEHEWTYGQSGGYTMFTPLTVDDAIYVGFGTDAIGDGSGELYALEYDGTERWTRDVGSVYDRPIVVDDTVYAGSDDGVVRAFDADDGSERWHNDDLSGQYSANVRVVAVTDVVYVATGRLVALDRDDGTVLWRYGDADDRIRDATVTDDVAYLTNRDGLVAVANGDERWDVAFDHNRWIQGIENGRVFVEHQYDIHAFALEDGDERWTVTNDDRAAVDFHGDRAYVGTDRLYALEAEDGSELWSVPIDGGDGDEPIQSVQVVTEGDGDSDGHSTFVQTNDDRLTRVDPTGESTWTDTVDGRIGSLVVRNGFAFVGSSEGIYSLSLGSQ